MRCVTDGCDASHRFRRPMPARGEPGASPRWTGKTRPFTILTRALTGLRQAPGTLYTKASRWKCGLQPFGLCANLIFCDESADSQAVPQIAVQTRVNQLRNIALRRSRRRCNILASRSAPLDFEVPCVSSTNFSTGSKCLSVGIRRTLLDSIACDQRQPTRPLRCCLQAGSRSAWKYAKTPD